MTNTLFNKDQFLSVLKGLYPDKKVVQALQQRIAVAYQNQNMSLVKQLQRELIENIHAQKMAVIQVANSNGSRTPGKDRFLMNNLQDIELMLDMLQKIANKPMRYSASPVRRVEIPKPGSDKKKNVLLVFPQLVIGACSNCSYTLYYLWQRFLLINIHMGFDLDEVQLMPSTRPEQQCIRITL